MLTKIIFIFGLLFVLSNSRSIHRYELGERYYYLKALKQQEAAARRFSNYYRPVDDYNFGYSVHDRFTGDKKSHKDTRKDGLVKGKSDLLDPEGYKRVVDYNTHDVNGFSSFGQKNAFGSSRFEGPFRTSSTGPFGTLAPPYSPILATAAPPTYHQFGSNVNKFYPIVNNDINNHVSDFFNGYSEGSFDQYY